MPMPEFTMRQLLEAGVHFGHQARRWNPKMSPYIFGVRNGVHIIDLQQTVPMMDRALKSIRDIAAKGGRILFVGTKHQAQDKIKESAQRCGQYYVNHRWLGGMMTNWNTISKSIARLRELDGILSGDTTAYTKKETLMMTREHTKLNLAIGGIKDMGGLPDALFIVDVTKEELAVLEARKLGIPVFAIIDTNANPDDLDFPIPGNDDSSRAIALYCDMFSQAVLDGLQAEMAAADVDTGKASKPAEEVLPGEKAKADAKAAKAAKAPKAKKDAAPKAVATEKDAEKTAPKKAAAEEKPKKQATA